MEPKGHKRVHYTYATEGKVDGIGKNHVKAKTGGMIKKAEGGKVRLEHEIKKEGKLEHKFAHHEHAEKKMMAEHHKALKKMEREAEHHHHKLKLERERHEKRMEKEHHKMGGLIQKGYTAALVPTHPLKGATKKEGGFPHVGAHTMKDFPEPQNAYKHGGRVKKHASGGLVQKGYEPVNTMKESGIKTDAYKHGGHVKKHHVEKKATGGIIRGLPQTPLTMAKRSNGIPGYKVGGKVKFPKAD